MASGEDCRYVCVGRNNPASLPWPRCLVGVKKDNVFFTL